MCPTWYLSPVLSSQCVCVCVRERERETDRQTDRQAGVFMSLPLVVNIPSER